MPPKAQLPLPPHTSFPLQLPAFFPPTTRQVCKKAGTSGGACAMPKLRVRWGERRTAVSIDADATVDDLKRACTAAGAAPTSDAAFELSLNKVDALQGDQQLAKAGVRGGDLLYVMTAAVPTDRSAAGPSSASVARGGAASFGPFSAAASVVARAMEGVGFRLAGTSPSSARTKRWTYLYPAAASTPCQVVVTMLGGGRKMVYGTAGNAATPYTVALDEGEVRNFEDAICDLRNRLALPLLRDVAQGTGLVPPPLLDTLPAPLLFLIAERLSGEHIVKLAMTSRHLWTQLHDAWPGWAQVTHTARENATKRARPPWMAHHYAHRPHYPWEGIPRHPPYHIPPPSRYFMHGHGASAGSGGGIEPIHRGAGAEFASLGGLGRGRGGSRDERTTRRRMI